MQGVIDSFFIFDMSVPKGALYIKLTDGTKLAAIRNSFPYYVFDDNELKDLSLENILSKGDSIYKPFGKDSIYIYKSNNYTYRYFLPTKEYSDSIFNRK